MPGGHCHFLGGAVANDTEARKLIDANAAAGAEMWESQFTVDQLRTIVSHAATHGLPVAAHAHGADAIEACVEAGVATIEHCEWLVGRRQIDLRDEIAKRMAARGIAVCSTSSPQDRGVR